MSGPPAFRRVTLIVADDSAEMRTLIRRVVAPLADVHECADGGEAVELYERVHPDGVLMDLRMGGMDGIEAMRRIGRLDPNARIVIVTEHDEPAVRRASAGAGACGFVPKDDLLSIPDLLRELFATPRTEP